MAAKKPAPLPMDKPSILRRVYLFGTLSEAERKVVAEGAMLLELERGDVVCREGEEGHTFYVVGSGSLQVSSGQPPRDIAVLGPGHYFGEMSLLTGEPRTATVVAKEPARLLMIDRPVLVRLFSRNPGIAMAMSHLVATRRAQLEATLAAEEESILTRIKGIFGLS